MRSIKERTARTDSGHSQNNMQRSRSGVIYIDTELKFDSIRLIEVCLTLLHCGVS